LPAGFFRRLLVDVENVNRRAMRRKFEGDGSADAASAAGDGGNFGVESKL